MIRKKLKLAITTFACALLLAGNPCVANASETNQEGTIVDEAQMVDAEDTSVGVHDGKVMLNETNFPDAGLREYLTSYADEDGYITVSDVTELHIPSSYGVKSLSGVEYFVNINTLDLAGCSIGQFDFSKLTSLISLNLYNCEIDKLDISENKGLKKINLRENGITELDVSQNVNLVEVSIGMEKLTEIDLTNNVNVGTLNLYKLPISEINVSNMPNLTGFFIEGTNISTLDVSKNTKLTFILASDTKLKEIDLSNNMMPGSKALK